jgi:NADH dehydrogenase [ubiquinone] 1 alpha subcomplex assembly factor 7
MTPAPPGPASLGDALRRLIAANGPISVAQFMAESNAHYYASRDPFGRDGDFITAPEISQMFGELTGLWLADQWLRAGREGSPLYVELGPGRGTLAADALRAMHRCGIEPAVHFIEGSPELRQRQHSAVAQAQLHHDLTTLPMDAPLLLVANEFLDALPVRQLIMTADGWREVMVTTDDAGAFVATAGRQPMDAAVPEARRAAEIGTVIETCPAAGAIVSETASRLVDQGGVAVFVDYGHVVPRTGSTLQAVARHRTVDPFATPGEADLTAHVDFPVLADIARSRGARWLGTITQGEWLRALGIDARAEVLGDAARQARDRLVGDAQMGRLFKVMALAGPDWPDAAGF